MSELNLLSNVVGRIDLIYEPDIEAPLLRQDMDILARRVAQPRKPFSDTDLSPYCLRIFLSAMALEMYQLDAADVQQHIEDSFPFQFEILRSVPQSGQTYLRLRLRPTKRFLSSYHEQVSLGFDRVELALMSRKVSAKFGIDSGNLSLDTWRSKMKQQVDKDAAGFFDYVQKTKWTAANERGVLHSTNPSVMASFKRQLYDPISKLLEIGCDCKGCARLFLPRDVSTDDNAQGYCSDCFSQRFYRCTICSATFSNATVVALPCNHLYCEQCFNRYFSEQLTKEKFPPKCCDQELNIAKYRKHLQESSLVLYVQTVHQLNEVKQIHCAQQSCKAPIGPSLISEGWGLCEACFFVTCQHCRQLKQLHDESETGPQRRCPDPATIGSVPEVNDDEHTKDSALTATQDMITNGTNASQDVLADENKELLSDSSEDGPPIPPQMPSQEPLSNAQEGSLPSGSRPSNPETHDQRISQTGLVNPPQSGKLIPYVPPVPAVAVASSASLVTKPTYRKHQWKASTSFSASNICNYCYSSFRRIHWCPLCSKFACSSHKERLRCVSFAPKSGAAR